MAKSTENEDLSLLGAIRVHLANLFVPTSPLHMITMHVSFCMHLDIHKISTALQYEQNLTTGIRKLIEKPISR